MSGSRPTSEELPSSPLCLPPSHPVGTIIDRLDSTNMEMVEPKEEINICVEQHDGVQKMPETVTIAQMSGTLFSSPLCLPPSQSVVTIIDRLDGTNIEMVEPKEEINNCVQKMPETVLCPVHPIRKSKSGPKPKGKGGHARCICGKTKRKTVDTKPPPEASVLDVTSLLPMNNFSWPVMPVSDEDVKPSGSAPPRNVKKPKKPEQIKHFDPIKELKKSERRKKMVENRLERAFDRNRCSKNLAIRMRRRAEEAEQELRNLKETLSVWDGEKLQLNEHCMEHIVKFRQLGVQVQKLPAALECAASFTGVKIDETPCLKMCRRALASHGKP